jgi:hypothetical protein
MERSPSCEASNCGATQVLPNILWNPKVHYSVRNSPPLATTLGQINPPIPLHPIILTSLFILYTHLGHTHPSCLFPFGFPTNILYAFFSLLPLPIRVTRPAYLTLLDSIIQTILGEEYNLRSPLLCNFPHPPVTSFLLAPNLR